MRRPPVQRAIHFNERGEVEALYPEFRDVRSQDLKPAYFDAGQFYWGTTQAFLDNVPLYSNAALPVIIPPYQPNIEIVECVNFTTAK